MHSFGGPDMLHATAMVNYPSGVFRFCASLSLGYITPLNVQWIVRDISQHYPPRRDKFLLELASNAHRARNSSGVVECNLPDIDECIIGPQGTSMCRSCPHVHRIPYKSGQFFYDFLYDFL